MAILDESGYSWVRTALAKCPNTGKFERCSLPASLPSPQEHYLHTRVRARVYLPLRRMIPCAPVTIAQLVPSSTSEAEQDPALLGALGMPRTSARTEVGQKFTANSRFRVYQCHYAGTIRQQILPYPTQFSHR